MNLARILENAASYFPDRPALREGEREITYARLNTRASRIGASLIRMGIHPGDPVALCASNSIDWIAFYFGVLKAGAVAITLSAQVSPGELSRLVAHAKPRLLFTQENRCAEAASLKGTGGLENVVCPGGDLEMRHLIEQDPGPFQSLDRERTDTAAVLYTGGTTGLPKGVMLTHENILFSSWNVAHYERSSESDQSLCFMPFNHVFGQIHIMNATLLSCGCLEILPAFDLDRILEALASNRVTKFFAVPTVYIRLLTTKDLNNRLGRLRYCFSAAASMAVEIVKEWKERTGLAIFESYGMTEAMPVTYNHYYPKHHLVGSVGQTVHGVEVQIRDVSGKLREPGQEGEICLRGPNVMKGYLDNPEGTSAAFWDGKWFRSGDVGRFDADGYLFLVDRLKDLVITGGENVYPREVEEALYQWPEVEECAVVGLPDREWGERVTAFIVPKPGRTLDPVAIKSFLKARLSPFKVPKKFVAVRELPKSPTGKILKREIKNRWEEY
jgi:long-chain acyl-CoA synthetase